MAGSSLQLRLVASGRGAWHFDNREFSGLLRKFKLIYAGDEYLVVLREDDETRQTDVEIQGSTSVDPLVMQLEGHWSVFRVSPVVGPEMLYHPLAFPQVDATGRLRRRRIRVDEFDSLEPTARRSFFAGRVKAHEEVADRTPPSLAKALCRHSRR